MKHGIRCYMSAGTATALDVSGYYCGLVEPSARFKVGTWSIVPFSTEHDAAEPLGFYLSAPLLKESLLYATDTYYIRPKFNGITHLLVECNYALDILRDTEASPAVRRRVMQSHMSLDGLKKWLSVNDLSSMKEVHLIHLSDDNSDEERFQKEIQAMVDCPVIVAQK